MTASVRLTAPEIQEILGHGFESNTIKRFKGSADYTVLVRFSKDPNGSVAFLDFEPPGSHAPERIPLGASNDLTPVADRIDSLIYQDITLA